MTSFMVRSGVPYINERTAECSISAPKPDIQHPPISGHNMIPPFTFGIMFFICTKTNYTLCPRLAARSLVRLKATKETILIALAVSFVALWRSPRRQSLRKMHLHRPADARCDAFLAFG